MYIYGWKYYRYKKSTRYYQQFSLSKRFHIAVGLCSQQLVYIMGACIGRCDIFSENIKNRDAERSKTTVVYQHYSKLQHGIKLDALKIVPNEASCNSGYKMIRDSEPDCCQQTESDTMSDIRSTPTDTKSSITNVSSLCKVCCNAYSNVYVPKLLACSHTICSVCAERSSRSTRKPGHVTDVEGTEGRKITFCPFCRLATYLPENGAVGLENNETVIFNRTLNTNEIEDNSIMEVDTESISSVSTIPTASNAVPAAQTIIETATNRLKTLVTGNSRVYTVTAECCAKCRVMVADIQLDCKHFVCRLCAYTGFIRIYHQRYQHRSSPIFKKMNNAFCPLCNDIKFIRFEFDVISENEAHSPKMHMLPHDEIKKCTINQRTPSPDNTRFKFIYPDLSMRLITHPPLPPQRMFNRRSPLQCTLTQRSLSCPVQTGRTFNEINGSEYTHSASYHQITEHVFGSSDVRQTPPVPPRRRVYKTSTLSQSLSTQLLCVKRFGRYSCVKMQTGCFEGPTKIAVSLDGHLAVVDQQQMTIQVFTSTADYLSMFKVMGVQDVCFVSCDKVAAATHHGVYVYTTAGYKLQRLFTSQGPVTCVASFKFGFIASTSSSVSIFNSNFVEQNMLSHRKYTTNVFKLFTRRKTLPLSGIKDVALNSAKDFVLLDTIQGMIFVVNENGDTKQVINPAQHVCGKFKNAQALVVDKVDNIIVVDTGNQRLLQFNNNGVFTKCLLNLSTPGASLSTKQKRVIPLYPQGVCLTSHGLLIVVLSGREQAQIRIYQNIEVN